MYKALSSRTTLSKWDNRIRYCSVALMSLTLETVAEYINFMVSAGKMSILGMH